MSPRFLWAWGFAAALAATGGGAVFAMPAEVAPAAAAFHLGTLKLSALRDADNDLANDGSVFGVDVGPAAVAQVLAAAGAPTDKIALGVDALVVQAPGRVMLFDTGLGPHVKGHLMASLARAGLAPTQITDVFITHTHGDHVGGLATTDGHLAFPNAAIRMSAREWAWMQSQARNKAMVALIAPRVRPFEPGDTLAPGVKAIALYGHTPGHVGYEIVSGHDRLIDIGDAAHSAVISLAKPDWAIEYDTDRKAGAVIRRALLTRVAAGHMWVFAPHFPFPGVGHVEAKGDGFVWKPGTP